MEHDKHDHVCDMDTLRSQHGTACGWLVGWLLWSFLWHKSQYWLCCAKRMVQGTACGKQSHRCLVVTHGSADISCISGNQCLFRFEAHEFSTTTEFDRNNLDLNSCRLEIRHDEYKLSDDGSINFRNVPNALVGYFLKEHDRMLQVVRFRTEITETVFSGWEILNYGELKTG
ncbi:hypothetical protein AVEN_211169-1 [Araneus ventricosus]|uniref:Uncharacterized protein n=1 Tax=Araneus ventricosus TaxID=182803 RepID=A0A4Y2MBZ6_ARAVE|nr:hypothetical protein AVEN_211169-1 [Araneus ventricosus]